MVDLLHSRRHCRGAEELIAEERGAEVVKLHFSLHDQVFNAPVFQFYFLDVVHFHHLQSLTLGVKAELDAVVKQVHYQVHIKRPLEQHISQ